jgi:hypothetical protein
MPAGVTMSTVAGDEPLVAVYAEDLTLCAELLEHVARWLTTAPAAVLANLATFPVPDPTGPAQLIAELGERAAHLHRLAQGVTQ